jgi:UDP-N-acetylmuramate dehydrogenase
MAQNTTQEPQLSHMAIEENIPLADKNWFGTGGPARFFCEPRTALEFQEALTFARNNNLKIFMLGQGANILISDAGFDGLVIRPRLTGIEIVEPTQTDSQPSNTEIFVQAGAGASLPATIEYCLNNNIVGLEEFSGIPGSIGGSVYINVHYFQFLIAQFLHEAQVIDKKTGELLTVSPEWFEFGYNKSRLQTGNYYLATATFKLKSCTDLEAAFARGRSVEIIRHRANRYPAKGTCGSFFRNFHDHEVTLESNGKKMIYVAYYLDKIGVKGALRHGNAIVSYQHANMLVNMGGATTQDLIEVACSMQQQIFDRFGIMPRPECLLIGFDTYPLLDGALLNQPEK